MVLRPQRYPQDQRQQTHASDASIAFGGTSEPVQWVFEPNRTGFATCTGKPYSDTNLPARSLRPAGVKIGAPWLSWHTLRRTHATLLSQSGASPKDAQAL